MTLTWQIIINRYAIFGVLLLASFSAVGVSAVGAQSSQVLSVTPTMFNADTVPGVPFRSQLRVINANEYPITVYVEAVNFAPVGEQGTGELLPILDQNEPGNTIAEWITIPELMHTIKPGAVAQVPFSINVPDDAPPGGHYAALLVGTRPPDSGAQVSRLETAQVVTSLVLLTVGGGVIEEARLREFITSQLIYAAPDTSFSVRVKNTGNVHLQPDGDITVTDMWGNEHTRIEIGGNSQFGNVLASSTREYVINWSSDWQLSHFGRHTAALTLGYGSESRQFMSAETHFWIIPWRGLLLGSVLISGLVGLVVLAVRYYIRRMLRLSGITPDLKRMAHRRTAPTNASGPGADLLDLRSDDEGATLQHRRLKWLRDNRLLLAASAAVVALGLLMVWGIYLSMTENFAVTEYYEPPGFRVDTTDT
jgi:hypothetical protein